jgi:hypothetical protein
MTYPLSEPREALAAPAAAAGLSRFSVRAVAEPSVLPRVVELFTLRDLVPASVRCEHHVAEGGLGIDLVVQGLTAQQADHLASRMRTFPTVTGVLLRHE